MTNTVKNTHASYDEMAKTWKRCRDAAIGERAVHAAREEYLPRLKEEEDDAYNHRLMMTTFFNATWRTIAGLRGIMFRKPPVVVATDEMKGFMANIDMAGSDMSALAQDVAEEALIVGRVGLLTDYPEVKIENATQADVKALGFRPLISLYRCESIINWRTVRVNGATVLSMVVLTEEVEIPKGEFERVTETHYRVLDLQNGVYRQRVFRINEKDEDELLSEVFPKIKNSPLTYIPFVFIGVDSVTTEVDDPPLVDLIAINFKHYGQATSYERGCFLSGLPTMFVSGVPVDRDEPIYIGGSVANILPPPEAKAYYVEIAGQFSALRVNLEDKKAEMAALGARMLEQGRLGVEAAETLARRQVGEESILSAMAQTISLGLTQALQWFATWAGISAETTYEINRDFLPSKMDGPTLTAMVAAWQQGAFSKETLFVNLKAGEIVQESVTFEEEEARIASQPTLNAMTDGTVDVNPFGM